MSAPTDNPDTGALRLKERLKRQKALGRSLEPAILRLNQPYQPDYGCYGF